jgi:hypothetical protein
MQEVDLEWKQLKTRERIQLNRCIHQCEAYMKVLIPLMVKGGFSSKEDFKTKIRIVKGITSNLLTLKRKSEII